MKLCIVCKQLFESHSGSHKYCSKKCKIINQKPGRKINAKRYYDSPLGKLKTLQAHAKERNIKCKIDKNDFIMWYNSQSKFCTYCKQSEINIKHDTIGKFKTLTLDRKDNKKGYSVDNIVLACYRCNAIKNKFLTYDEMIKVGKIIQRRKD